MLAAAIWGAVASLSLFLGSIIGIYLSISKKFIAYLMALGVGVLIGASSFDLLIESVHKSGIFVTSASFLGGALIFTIIELFLQKKGGSSRKRSNKKPVGHSGLAIYIGTLMDAIPESLIIGLHLLNNKQVDFLFVIAIFISNLPESLSSTVGLVKDGYSRSKIIFLWTSVVVISSISSIIGYSFLANTSTNMMASIESFGAGGLIAMVCSTMLPEAFENGGPIIGFICCLGLVISLSFTAMNG